MLGINKFFYVLIQILSWISFILLSCSWLGVRVLRHHIWVCWCVIEWLRHRLVINWKYLRYLLVNVVNKIWAQICLCNLVHLSFLSKWFYLYEYIYWAIYLWKILSSFLPKICSMNSLSLPNFLPIVSIYCLHSALWCSLPKSNSIS